MYSRISQKLTTSLTPTHLEVFNESHMHSVPPNSETHFKVVVVSEIFEDKKLLDRHRLVIPEYVSVALILQQTCQQCACGGTGRWCPRVVHQSQNTRAVAEELDRRGEPCLPWRKQSRSFLTWNQRRDTRPEPQCTKKEYT